MQFYVMTRTHVRQFTLVHVAKCHNIKSWIMSSYFPMTGFKATVCASTGDKTVPLAIWNTISNLHDNSHMCLQQYVTAKYRANVWLFSPYTGVKSSIEDNRYNLTVVHRQEIKLSWVTVLVIRDEGMDINNTEDWTSSLQKLPTMALSHQPNKIHFYM